MYALTAYWRDGNLWINGEKRYSAGELLTAYLNLNTDRLEALERSVSALRGTLLYPSKSDSAADYEKKLERALELLEGVDKLCAKLPPYNRINANGTARERSLSAAIAQSSLFIGDKLRTSYTREDEQAWAGLADSVLVCYEEFFRGLAFCRNTAAPILDSIDAGESISETALNSVLELNVRCGAVAVSGEQQPCLCADIETLLQLAQLDLAVTLMSGVKPRRCGCCGRFFLPSNPIAKFCDRKAPDAGGRLCREVGARRKYEERAKADPILAAYSRAYKTRYARMTKGAMTQKEFSDWSKAALQLRNQAVNGGMDAQSFTEQLKALD